MVSERMDNEMSELAWWTTYLIPHSIDFQIRCREGVPCNIWTSDVVVRTIYRAQSDKLAALGILTLLTLK